MTTIEKLTRTRPRKFDVDGDEFFVRPMTVGEYIQSDAMRAATDKWLDLAKWLVCRCTVDANGAAIFTGDDDPRLGDLPMEMLQRLTQEIFAVSSSGTPATK